LLFSVCALDKVGSGLFDANYAKAQQKTGFLFYFCIPCGLIFLYTLLRDLCMTAGIVDVAV